MAERMNSKLKQIECPFTWGVEKQWARNFDEMDEPITSFDEEPLLALISSIMLTYIRAEKEDYEGATENLEVTDEIWIKIDRSHLKAIGVSAKVLLHIKTATAYFIYSLLNRKTEADQLLKKLKSSESFQNSIEVATIHGCKSVAWSSFHELGNKKAQEFARMAKSKSSNCSLWYYILGRSLRHSRREIYGNFDPLAEEQESFIEACKLSDTPFYKIHLAQMYREKKDYLRSHEICLEIFQKNPESFGILLKLASGFMYAFNDFDRAKKCLDEARKLGQNSMYHHFMGVFYSKQKKHELAVMHYEIAALKGKNFKAEMQHAHSLVRLNKNFNLIQHLEKMLVKHGQNSNYKQQIFLHIAMQYYFKEIDIVQTLNYLLQAIELHPESQQLIEFFNSTIDWRRYNIYDFASKILRCYDLDPCASSILKYDDLSKLKEFCKKYQETRLSESIEDMQIRG